MSLRKKGFTPYIVVVFINAFVDLGHKIVIQNTIFKIYDGQHQVVLTAIVNGLILLPFILLFSPSGFLADKFAKNLIIRYSAVVAVVATLMITFCYYQGWFWASFGLTFALAVQSAIYSPAKYGYIKELVGNENLASANGVVQATTITGILLGTLVFSVLFEGLLSGQLVAGTGDIMGFIAPIGWVLVALSIVEWFCTAFLPDKQTRKTTERFEMAPYVKLQYLRRNLRVLEQSSTIWLSIIGLATFWAISQVMLAAFPAFAKGALGITNTIVIQGILACTGVGIVVGSLIAGKASKNYIETGLIPIGALGIAIGIAILPGLNSAISMGVVFTLVGVMGGMFIVPLNSLIQFHAKEGQLGTVLAGNNWIQNVAMLSALSLTVAFALLGIDSVGLFYILTAVAIVGTGYTVYKLPLSLVRIIVTVIFNRRYRIEVMGFKNIPQAGATLMLGNHISWIDWALVQIACPRPLRFVMFKGIYDTWYLKPIFKFFGVVPIAAGRSSRSLEAINQLLKNGECVCLFPEGAISRNGQLGKFHTGYERALEGVEQGVIVPFYLRGLWGSSLSNADEGLRNARAPDIRRDLIIAFGKPLPLNTGAKQLKQKVFDLSLDAWHSYAGQLDPIPLAWLRATRRSPASVSCADSRGPRLTHRQMAAEVVCFAQAMKLQRKPLNIGVLLPTSSAAAITTLAVLLRGRVLVPLDAHQSRNTLQAAIEATAIEQVYTSHAFAELLAQQGIVLSELLQGVAIHYVEDIRKKIPAWRLLLAKIQFTVVPVSWFYRLRGRRVGIADPAALLFDCSGNNANPQPAVVLSHRNIMANCKQISDVLNTRVDDVILCSLPPCSARGLTAHIMMPLVEGIPMVCNPDLSDPLSIAKTVARARSTIMVGPPELLEGLVSNNKVHPLMLESIRVVVAGLGPLSEDVRVNFGLKFGKTIYDGYGSAETTALASVNIPDAMGTSDWKVQQGNMPGTVGMPLPGTSFKIVDPTTLQMLPLGADGLVLISGDQVMSAYLHDEEGTARVISEIDGMRWFHSGDKGHLTEEGFLVIS